MMHLFKFVLAALAVGGAVAAPVEPSASAVMSVHTSFPSGAPTGFPWDDRHLSGSHRPHPSGSHSRHPHPHPSGSHSGHPHPSGSHRPHPSGSHSRHPHPHPSGSHSAHPHPSGSHTGHHSGIPTPSVSASA